jgi:hypothetical protein
VRQKIFDRDVVADEREVLAEHRPRGRGQKKGMAVDQADDRERGQSLRSAGDREPSVDRVRYVMGAVGEAVGLGELNLAMAVQGHDAGESVLLGDRVDRLGQGPHPVSV